MVWALIGSLICFLGMFGFGLTTNIYGDFLRTSKKTNDIISFVTGVLLAVVVLCAS
jgi:hypothetical protein